MTHTTRLLAVSTLALSALVHISAQQAPPAAPAGGRGAQPPPQQGGPPPANFPQQQRPPGDPVLIERGKALYQSTCAACHGIDLRGGQQGGPNLLRSQTVLSDKNGELIAPIVQGGRPNPPAGAPPMPPFALPPDDIKALVEYLHSVLGQAGAQGRPPEGVLVTPEKILVGDAAAGEKYFAARCASCHSVSGDLQGIASRVTDPRALQDLWVSGGGGRGRGRGRGADAAGQQRSATVTVTPASGASCRGTPSADRRLHGLVDSRGRDTANLRADRRRSQGGREGSRRRAPEARARAGRQGHAQRDGISLDDQVMTRTIAGLLVVASIGLAARTETGLDPATILKPLADSWPTYSGDYTGKRYSSLAQVNQTTVKNLSLAWLSRGFVEGSGPTGRGNATGPAGGGGAVADAGVAACRSSWAAKAAAPTTAEVRHASPERSSWSTVCCMRPLRTISGRWTRATARSSGSTTGRRGAARTRGIAASGCGTTTCSWRRTTTTC